MKLPNPVPDPRRLRAVLERGTDQVEALLGLVPRASALLEQAESLALLLPRAAGLVTAAEAQLSRVGPVLDDIEVVVAACAAEAAQVETVVVEARASVTHTNVVIAEAQVLVERLRPLLDLMEPPLTKLQPSLEVIAETTDPTEVAALVAMIDRLPELTRRLDEEVLPLLGTLATVAPDLHDLLAVSTDLNEIIGKVPGFGRIKRRVEEDQEDESS